MTMMRMEEACGRLSDEGIRFGDLFRTISHISEKMLASTLDYLEGEGLVTRRAHDSVPPCVEYSLTPLARNFLREISYVIEWEVYRTCSDAMCILPSPEATAMWLRRAVAILDRRNAKWVLSCVLLMIVGCKITHLPPCRTIERANKTLTQK